MTARLTKPQREALRYVAALREDPDLAADMERPRWDVLRRLRAQGLIDYAVTYHTFGTTGRARPQAQQTGLRLTAAGRDAL